MRANIFRLNNHFNTNTLPITPNKKKTDKQFFRLLPTEEGTVRWQDLSLMYRSGSNDTIWVDLAMFVSLFGRLSAYLHANYCLPYIKISTKLGIQMPCWTWTIIWWIDQIGPLWNINNFSEYRIWVINSTEQNLRAWNNVIFCTYLIDYFSYLKLWSKLH